MCIRDSTNVPYTIPETLLSEPDLSGATFNVARFVLDVLQTLGFLCNIVVFAYFSTEFKEVFFKLLGPIALKRDYMAVVSIPDPEDKFSSGFVNAKAIEKA